MPAGLERPRKTGPPLHILQEHGHPNLQVVLGNLLPRITSRILLTRILEGEMNPPLKRLNPSNGPVRHQGCTSDLVIHLQFFNLPKEKVNLVHLTSPGIPTRLLHRGAKSARRKRRRKIPNIEPHLLPVDDLLTQLVRDVLGLLPLMKLQPGSPDYIYLRFVGMGFR